MPRATRLTDHSTGHDACASMPLVTGSPDVFTNSLNAGRAGDLYDTHGCIVHPGHQDYISQGSTTVFINSIPAGRVGDAVSIGGTVAGGSKNVYIGG